METRTHPTHHDTYRGGRVFFAVAVALAGLFVCVFLATMDAARAASVGRQPKAWALWAGGVAFVVGALYVAVIDITHRFTRCPSCRRRILRSRIDFQQSYYPCRRCGVMWTCPCHQKPMDA